MNCTNFRTLAITKYPSCILNLNVNDFLQSKIFWLFYMWYSKLLSDLYPRRKMILQIRHCLCCYSLECKLLWLNHSLVIGCRSLLCSKGYQNFVLACRSLSLDFSPLPPTNIMFKCSSLFFTWLLSTTVIPFTGIFKENNNHIYSKSPKCEATLVQIWKKEW